MKEDYYGDIPQYLKQFGYVMAIEQYGGITQAAEVLHIAQPALSRYLKKIESEIGLELFDRTSLPIRLTVAGECYIEAGRRMMDVARQLDKRLDEIRCTNNAALRIGISPSRTAYLLPDILAEFRRHIGNTVGIVIVEKGINELNVLLQNGSVDLIFSFDIGAGEDLNCIPLFEEKMLLAVPESLAEASRDTSELLQTAAFVQLPPDTRTGRLTRKILKEWNITPQESLSCLTVESALAMVRAGLGITIVPSYIAGSGKLNGLSFLSLETEGILSGEDKTRFCLICRKNQYLTATEREFIRCTEQILLKKKGRL